MKNQSSLNIPKEKKIVLYDGVCGFCNEAMLYVVKHDKLDAFRFVQLDSILGREILTDIGMADGRVDSIVLYESTTRFFYKSAALLLIARHLNKLRFATRILSVVPVCMLDKVYDVVARNRHRLIAHNACALPDLKTRAKFL